MDCDVFDSSGRYFIFCTGEYLESAVWGRGRRDADGGRYVFGCAAGYQYESV